jgi:nitrogen regulatory protein P-II 1
MMKKIEAVIRPCLLEQFKESLQAIGICGMTITHAAGASGRENPRLVYRAAENQVEFVQMLRVEVVLEDDDAEVVLSAISAQPEPKNLVMEESRSRR